MAKSSPPRRRRSRRAASGDTRRMRPVAASASPGSKRSARPRQSGRENGGTRDADLSIPIELLLPPLDED
jgi:hypothetical protein